MITRHRFLSGLHTIYRPRSYLEIGIYKGWSLALSRVPSIGIDPDFRIVDEIRCDVQLARATSDDFFARPDALAHLPNATIDLGFIDGMHRFENVLRDFINVERSSAWTSVIVIDDVLPRNVAEASRERGEMVAWAGDVFKIAEVLHEHRPDLLTYWLDTDPTGVLLVLGADPLSTTLADRYDGLISQHVQPDPQEVPEAILSRSGAVDPEAMLSADFWADLVEARDSGVSRESGIAKLRDAAAAAARPTAAREVTPAMLEPPVPARRKASGKTAGTNKKMVKGLPPRHTLTQHAASEARRRLRPLRRLPARIRGRQRG